MMESEYSTSTCEMVAASANSLKDRFKHLIDSGAGKWITWLNDFHSAPADDATGATAGFAGSDMDRPCIYTKKWRQKCFLQEEHGVFTMHAAPTTDHVRATYVAPINSTATKQPAAQAAAEAANPAHTNTTIDETKQTKQPNIA